MDMKVNSENGNNIFGSPHKLFSKLIIKLLYFIVGNKRSAQ